MTRLRFGLLAVLVLVGCGPTVSVTGKCTTKSCQGCCSRDTCVPLSDQSDTLCGAGGLECSGCGGSVCVAGQCLGVDPCATNHGGCDVNATCASIGGDKTCTCPTGFAGNGVRCSPLVSSITVSAGFVSPAFSPTSVNYIVVMPAATTSLTVSATTVATATLSIDGVPGPSHTFTPGSAPQTVAVEARATLGGATRRYALLVSRSSTTLSQRASFKPSNTAADFRFGAALAISGDGLTAAVAAPMEGSGASLRSGAVYVFRNTAGVWAQEAYLKATVAEPYDNFGWCLALSNDGSTLAIGAPGEDGVAGDPSSNASNDSGAVYVFRRSGTAWSQEAYVKSSSSEALDGFGWAVALSGDGNRLAAGAPFDDGASNATESSGAAFVFTRSGESWSQDAVVRAGSDDRGDQFGRAVALSADGASLAVGAPGEDSAATGVGGSQSDNTKSNSGAVYVFRRGGSWAADAYVKASNSDVEDRFGSALSLSADGSVLAVGAPGESSEALGIDGDTTSNGAPASGAVYVLRRAAGWTQEAYVKATNTGAGDRFGWSVVVSQDGATLVVGAPGDDSDAAGIDGNQGSDAATDSGAVFVYRKTTAWNRLAFAKPALPGAGDSFGAIVSVSSNGSSWLSGAAGDDSSATGVNGDLSNNGAMESGAAFVFSE